MDMYEFDRLLEDLSALYRKGGISREEYLNLYKRMALVNLSLED